MDPSFRQSVGLTLRSQTLEEYLMYRRAPCQIGNAQKGSGVSNYGHKSLVFY